MGADIAARRAARAKRRKAIVAEKRKADQFANSRSGRIRSAAEPIGPVKPSYARKLLHDLVRWSADHGVRPHQDYAVVERLFGSVRAQDCMETFRFGFEGKPLLVPGPDDTPANLRERMLSPSSAMAQAQPDGPPALEGVAE